jgi:hypothetical protein
MHERGITAPTALACLAAGEKSPGKLGATRHHLMGFTAVTVPWKDGGLKVLTVYGGRPYDTYVGTDLEPCRIVDKGGSVI